MMSVLPPAANGVITVTVFVGHSVVCACAVAVSAANGSGYYVPALLLGSGAWGTDNPINPGTDVGTIALTLPSGVTTVRRCGAGKSRTS